MPFKWLKAREVNPSQTLLFMYKDAGLVGWLVFHVATPVLLVGFVGCRIFGGWNFFFSQEQLDARKW